MNCTTHLVIFMNLLILSQSVAVVPAQTGDNRAKHHHESLNICKTYFDGTVLPHPTNCHKFYMCVNNQPIEYNCDADFHFDKKSYSCIAGSECSILKEPSVTCNEGSIQSVADDCYIFETCINGQYQKISCPSGHYFYAPQSICRPIHYNAQFKCNCELPEHTVMENRDNCQTFYLCENRKAHLKKCPLDQYYNSTINACLPDLEGICLMHPTKVPLYQLKTETETFIDTKGNPSCEHLSNSEAHFQAHKKFCNKFYICANGQLYERHCPQGYYFDGDTKYCVVDRANKCQNGGLTIAKELLQNNSQESYFKSSAIISVVAQQQQAILKEEAMMLPPNLYYQSSVSKVDNKKPKNKFIQF